MHLAAFQFQLEKAIITATTGKKLEASSRVDWMQPQDGEPLTSTTSYSSVSIDKSALAACVILPFAFLPLLSLSLSIIGDEKRTRLIGPIRRMGLYESAYWLSNLVPMLIVSLLTSAMLSIGIIVTGLVMDTTLFGISSVDVGLVFLFSFAYAVSLSAFGLFIVSLFSRELYLNLAQGIL